MLYLSRSSRVYLLYLPLQSLIFQCMCDKILILARRLSISHSRSRSACTAPRAGTDHVRNESRDCQRSLLIPARRSRCDWYRASERGHCTFSGTHATRGLEQLPLRTPNDLSRVTSHSFLQLLLLPFLFLSLSLPPMTRCRTLPLPLDLPTRPLASSYFLPSPLRAFFSSKICFSFLELSSR